MNHNFEKIKRKFRRAATLRFALLGIASGAVVAAALVIVQKLISTEPNLLVAMAIGGAIALFVAGGLLLLCYPTEKRIARALDDRAALGEKVQTLVQFKNESSDMLEIQRQDTEELLATIPFKRMRDRHAWRRVILPLLAAVVTVTAVLLPVRTESSAPVGDVPGEEDVWQLTEWHITAVRALIEEVKASNMQQPGRESVVELLEKLLADLEYVTSKAVMKRTVMDCMVRVNAITDGINTYTLMARAMRDGGNAKVKELADAIGTPSDPLIESKYQALKASLSSDGTSETIRQFAIAISVAIETVGAPAEDALYVSLAEYSEQLVTLSQQMNEMDEREMASALSGVFDSAAERIGAALQQQGINRQTTDRVLDGLMSIFGISWNELPDELKYSNDEEAATKDEQYEEKEDELVGGGKGNGEVIYGSDDAVYDPKQEAHVKYGDVIDEYNGQKVTDMQERPLTDEQKEFIDKYFADLYYKENNN